MHKGMFPHLPLVQLLGGEGELLQARALAGNEVAGRNLRPVLHPLPARHIERLVREAAQPTGMLSDRPHTVQPTAQRFVQL